MIGFTGITYYVIYAFEPCPYYLYMLHESNPEYLSFFGVLIIHQNLSTNNIKVKYRSIDIYQFVRKSQNITIITMSSGDSGTTTTNNSSSASTDGNIGKRRPIYDYVVNVLLRPSNNNDWWITIMNQIRHIFWCVLYRTISKTQDDTFQFINYGYVPDDENDEIQGGSINDNITKYLNDKCGSTCLQLYYEVVRPILPLHDKDVIEIGCGRGGGTAYIAQYLQPKSIVGIDLCANSIQFATKTHTTITTNSNLQFQIGNAMDLHQIQNNSYDIVVNVESSHCYTSFEQFIKEVYRILKNNGYCVLCDMRILQHIPTMENDVRQAGFTIIENINITNNVLQSMKLCTPSREQLMKDTFGIFWFTINKLFFTSFAGLYGSIMYDKYQSGTIVYKRYVLQKIEK